LAVVSWEVLEILQLLMSATLRFPRTAETVQHWNRLGDMSRVVGGRSSVMGVLEEGEVDV
jgi:hypothetical protein